MRFHLYRKTSGGYYANRLLVIGLCGRFIYIDLKGLIP